MRVFLIGYEPAGWNFGLLAANFPMQRKLEQLLQEADVASVLPRGWPIGAVLEVAGKPFICTDHEHDGKVVVVRPCGN